MDTQAIVVIILFALFLIAGAVGGHYATKMCHKETSEIKKAQNEKSTN